MFNLKDIRPLHIGKFIPPPYAGVEAHVDSLLKSLSPVLDVTLVAGKSSHTKYRSSYEPCPYRIIQATSFGKFASATLSPGVLTIARNELLSGRSNLLHIHSPNPWGDLAALSLPQHIPVVMSWHSDIIRQKFIMNFYKYIQSRVIQRVDKIIVATPNHYLSSAQLNQCDISSKIVSVPYGINFSLLQDIEYDQDFFLEIKKFANQSPIVLTVGRHVSYKGYSHLLSAFSKIRSGAVLVMIGIGPLTNELMNLAGELGISSRILFVGEANMKILTAAFRACDFFCLPSVSQTEAFGIASAEAMSFGKPTIVCNLQNGVNYLNKDGVTSIVVEPFSTQDLANAIDLLANDVVLRSRMAKQAKKWVESEFSIEAMRNGVLNVYKSLFGVC